MASACSTLAASFLFLSFTAFNRPRAHSTTALVGTWQLPFLSLRHMVSVRRSTPSNQKSQREEWLWMCAREREEERERGEGERRSEKEEERERGEGERREREDERE